MEQGEPAALNKGEHFTRLTTFRLILINVCSAVIALHLSSLAVVFYDVMLRSHGGIQMYYMSLLFFAVLYGLALYLIGLMIPINKPVFIVCCALASYLAFGFACLIYAFAFDLDRTLNTLYQMHIGGFVVPFMLIFPCISGSWLGGIIGALGAILISKTYSCNRHQLK